MRNLNFGRITKGLLVMLVAAVLALSSVTSVASARASTETKVTVAILDTGIDRTHHALAGRILASVNLTGSPTENDVNGHGTHIAGIIAKAENAAFLNVKVAEDDGVVYATRVAAGIRWATDNGAKIINISLTNKDPAPALEEAISYAWEKGAVIIAAAGNGFGTAPVYPAAYHNVIGVAATDDSGKLAKWSNRGEWVKTAAPGVNILSALPGDTQGVKSGTSQAAAAVSAKAVTLVAGGESNAEVLQTLKQ